MEKLKKLYKEDNGQVLVMFALMLTVLMGFAALVIDVGVGYVARGELQNAADAAALAGAGVSSNQVGVAKSYAKENGVVEDAEKGTVVRVTLATKAGTTAKRSEKAYTQEDITQMIALYKKEYSDLPESELVALAQEEMKRILINMNGSELFRYAHSHSIDLPNNYTTGSGQERVVKEQDMANAVAHILEHKFKKGIMDKAGAIEEVIATQREDWEEELIEVGNVGSQSRRVEVALTEYVPFSFARILGIAGTHVSVDATAERMEWAGDALPFINLDGKAENSAKGEPLEAWNKTGPGDKERIGNEDLIVSDHTIQVNYQDGFLTFKKGKVMSKIQRPLQEIARKGKIVYLFSIKASEIPNYQKKAPKELKNGDKIPLSDTVLLKCEVMKDWSGTGSDTIELKFIEAFTWNPALKDYLSLMGEKPGHLVKLVD